MRRSQSVRKNLLTLKSPVKINSPVIELPYVFFMSDLFLFYSDWVTVRYKVGFRLLVFSVHPNCDVCQNSSGHSLEPHDTHAAVTVSSLKVTRWRFNEVLNPQGYLPKLHDTFHHISGVGARLIIQKLPSFSCLLARHNFDVTMPHWVYKNY